MFTIKLHRPPDTVEKTVEETVEKILELIRKNPHITIDELSGLMGKFFTMEIFGKCLMEDIPVIRVATKSIAAGI